MVVLRSWHASVAGLAIALLAGCTAPGRRPAAAIPPSTPPADEVQPGAAQAADAQSSVVRDLIDDAARLPFSSERADFLRRIAARGDLTTRDQVALVDAACQVGFSDYVKSIFLTLARNPVLTPTGELHLRERIDCIPFSSHRNEVLKALTKRAPAAPG